MIAGCEAQQTEKDVTKFIPTFYKKKMYFYPIILCDTVGKFAVYLHRIN